MYFFQHSVFAAAFACVSALPYSAAPHKHFDARSKTTFSVKQNLKSDATSKPAGPITLARTIGKYSYVGANIPPLVRTAAMNAAQSTGRGTVTADPTRHDAEYIESVTIGGQTLKLDFDTGSSDLWVFSDELPKRDQQNHNIYSPRKSSSATKLKHQKWKVSYGDKSSASGDVYSDTINVDGVTLANQAIETAKKVSLQFITDTNDGLLGLGFSSINTVQPQKQTTFFANAKSQLDAPLFTANLKKGEPGNYNFGFIDQTEYTGSIIYTEVDNSHGYWGFTSDSCIIADGQPISSSIKSIADTGTSLLLIDDSLVTAYYGHVHGSYHSAVDGGFVFPCDAALPNISFVIGGYKGTIPGSYMNYAPASASGSCYGGIQSNAGMGFSIFGDIWLKSQFVVFEDAPGGPRIGHAARRL